MKINAFAGKYQAIAACLFVTAGCAAPTEMTTAESSMLSAWAEAEAQENAALRRQSREQSTRCPVDQVPVCKVSGRLGKRVCACEDVTDTFSWAEETELPEDY